MTKTISAQLFVSLDLVVAEPRDWHFPWVGDLMLAEIAREQATSTLLLGRRTYDSFAESWPARGDEVPLARQLNTMRKIVVSDRLAEGDAQWRNTTVLRPRGDLAAAVGTIEVDDRITIAGSITLVEQLLALELLGELRLITHPIVVGTGRRLFDDWAGPRIELDHTDSLTLDRGARVDVYHPISPRADLKQRNA